MIPALKTRRTRSISNRARVPKIIAGTLAGVLILAGTRAILAGPATSRTIYTPAPASDTTLIPSLEGYAESFAYRWLTWTPSTLEARSTALQGMVADGVDANAGLTPPISGSGTTQKVTWATTVALRHPTPDVYRVVIAAHLAGGTTTYVEVPVARNAAGAVAIVDVPSIVGPPVTDPTLTFATEGPVDDSDLRTIAGRAITNYLTASRENLAADLAPGTTISLPGSPFGTPEVSQVTWVNEDAGTIVVDVRIPFSEGGQIVLRYPMSVTKTDRWYVTAIGGTDAPVTTPAAPAEGAPEPTATTNQATGTTPTTTAPAQP